MNLTKQQLIEYKFKVKREHDPEIKALIVQKIEKLESELHGRKQKTDSPRDQGQTALF